MAQDNVELVRRIIELFNRKDIARVMDAVADDFELDWSNSIGPLKGVYKGREGALELWESFLDAWDEIRWDPQEIIEVDEARVILVNHVRMRGGGSGVDVEATAAQLWTIADGKGRSVMLYQSKAEALAAAQLAG